MLARIDCTSVMCAWQCVATHPSIPRAVSQQRTWHACTDVLVWMRCHHQRSVSLAKKVPVRTDTSNSKSPVWCVLVSAVGRCQLGGSVPVGTAPFMSVSAAGVRGRVPPHRGREVQCPPKRYGCAWAVVAIVYTCVRARHWIGDVRAV